MAELAVLTCRIGARRIAIPARDVLQILPLLPIARPPTLPVPLLGFVTVAGAPVAVLDPVPLFEGAGRSALGLYSHLVRLAGAVGVELCLAVDRAEDFARIDEARLRPVPPDRSLNGCAVALAGDEDAPVHLVEVARLLDAEERARLAALGAQAAARKALWTQA